MRSIDDRLDSFAEAWKPEPGDKLIGTVVDLDERDSAYGDEPYPIVTVETDDGNELAFHAFHTVARNELAKQRPAIGDRIGIAYHGKQDGKNYESYRVIVERAEPEPKRSTGTSTAPTTRPSRTSSSRTTTRRRRGDRRCIPF